jgi:hypothetical protein
VELMRVEIVIDELVLVGFDARDRHRIADAIERELSERVTGADAMGLARAEGGHALLRARDYVAPAGQRAVTAAAIGAGVGRSIAASLSADRPSPQPKRGGTR